MLYLIKDREDSEKIEELASLQNQVKIVRLQDKLSEQNSHEVMKKVFEQVTDTIENTSEDLTKTMVLISKENNKVIQNLNNKLLEFLSGRDILASHLLSPLFEITNL